MEKFMLQSIHFSFQALWFSISHLPGGFSFTCRTESSQLLDPLNKIFNGKWSQSLSEPRIWSHPYSCPSGCWKAAVFISIEVIKLKHQFFLLTFQKWLSPSTNKMTFKTIKIPEHLSISCDVSKLNSILSPPTPSHPSTLHPRKEVWEKRYWLKRC